MDPSNRHEIARLREMFDSGLVNWQQITLWADEIIAHQGSPPNWILYLSTAISSQDASQIIREFIYSEPFIDFSRSDLDDYHIACLFLRFDLQELPWASFLKHSAEYADGQGGKRDCEYFYSLLNELENNGFDINVESRQVIEVAGDYDSLILDCRKKHQPFCAISEQNPGRNLA